VDKEYLRRRLAEFRTLAAAALIAALVAVFVTVSIVGGSKDDVRVHNASAEVTTSTTDSTTTTAAADPTTSTSSTSVTTTRSMVTPTTRTTGVTVPASGTTTAPRQPTATASVGPVVYPEDNSSHVPVTLTVANGPALRVMVCLQGTIDLTGDPFPLSVFFNDVSGTATQDATYAYGYIDSVTKQPFVNKLLPEVKVTLVHIVTSPWDSTPCPPVAVPPALSAPKNVKVSLVRELETSSNSTFSLVEMTWDEVPGATGYVVEVQTYGSPVVTSCCSAQLRAPEQAWISVQARKGPALLSAPTTVRWEFPAS
jgi:hypothetical protein